MAANDAFVGLGSNMAEPSAQLAGAVARLAALPNTELVAQSPFYSSKPVGPQDQPDFINAVAALDTRLSPLALLDQLQALEQQHRRRRVHTLRREHRYRYRHQGSGRRHRHP